MSFKDMTAIKSTLIIGGSGFVGTHLALRLRDSYKVFATYHKHPVTIPGVTTLPMDVDNRTWIKRVILMSKPDFVIFCPAYTENMRRAKDFTELERLHSKGAATVLNCAEMYHPKFIYLSTCEVFDGDRGNYRETEPALPATSLGKAKMAAENYIRSRSLHSVIIRCSPLFGRGNGLNLTFTDRLRIQLDRGKAIDVPANEIHSFAHVEGLAEVVAEVLARPAVRNKSIHYGGLTKMTLVEFAKIFARRFGYDPKLITPTMPVRDDAPNSVHRTSERKAILDFSLNSSQAVELLKIKPLLLQESLDLIEKKLVVRP